MKYRKVLEALQEAERNCVPIGPVSDMVPGGMTLDDAKAIAEEGIRRRVEQGQKLVGYKVGFTNIAVRKSFGVPGPVYGRILDTMVLKGGDVCRVDELIAPRIETEICLRLKEDLSGSKLSIERVMEATEGVRPAIEIVDARIRDWKCAYPDFFADNGVAARIVLGGDEWLDSERIDLREVRVVLYKNGAKVAEGKGANALNHPANAVIWLAEELGKRAKRVKSGELVMTGTLTPILPVSRGDHYRAVFSSLGEVTVTFV